MPKENVIASQKQSLLFDDRLSYKLNCENRLYKLKVNALK